MKSKERTITLQAIRAYVGEKSFSRGESYARNGHVSNLRQAGATVKADCQGSEMEPYRVVVEIADGEIVASSCTCPIGGACKHVAAVMIEYVEHPEDVRQVEDTRSALSRRSKEQLIELIEQMLAHAPELEDLIEIPVIAEARADEDIEALVRTYARQAARAFGRAGYEWGHQRAVSRELQTIVCTGNRFLEQGHIAQAAAVFQTVLDTVLAHPDEVLGDEEGALFNTIGDCTEGLSRCLTAGADDALRGRVLDLLMKAALADIEFGGVGLGDAAWQAVLDQAEPQEKGRLAERIRGEIGKRSDKSFHSNWQREALGDMLLQLEGDELDDESFIRICRETGRTYDLIERLLSLERVDEAVAEAEQAQSHDVQRIAESFVAHRQAERILPLVERHANAPNNFQLDEWLYGYYVKQKNWPAALERALHRFRAWPNLDSYQRVQQVAAKQDAWDALRPTLIREGERKGDHALLTEIYLDEGDIDAALRAFAKAQQTRSLRWGFDQPDELTIRVAQAAASTYPREARKIYLDEAERLVALRGRVAYQEACALLKRVQEIDKTLGETEAWHAFLSDFQMRHKRLRALQEEMHAAKLI
ncbi:MAG: SWIM zinc finger family protein [Anaerolineae bacterium]|nr:SWIM zinc finger family protein [Candidatus Roseilinea sp.]MDW8449319.1 SWIM zinc finger family protein [Anaerolineae bacterium]